MTTEKLITTICVGSFAALTAIYLLGSRYFNLEIENNDITLYIASASTAILWVIHNKK
jgi:hypothetical protein